MIYKSFFLEFLLIISVFIFSFQQQCIQGQNCPFNQGICVLDTCECTENYHTLIDETLLPNQQIYCNYKKYSQYFPIILEMILPSSGHFLVGKYWMCALKLSLLIIFISSSYYLYNSIKCPEIFMSLFKTIGLSTFIGGEEEDNEDDNDEGDEDGDRPVSNRPHRQRLLSEDISNISDEEKDNIIIKFLFEISGIFFSLLYFLDLFFYKFKVYKDGNDVPFV